MTKSVKLWRWHGKPCAYCGGVMNAPSNPPKKAFADRIREVTRDHALVLAKENGGLAPTNRVMCCYGCNIEKADRPLDVWLSDLRIAGDARVRLVEAALEALYQRQRDAAEALHRRIMAAELAREQDEMLRSETVPHDVSRETQISLASQERELTESA